MKKLVSTLAFVLCIMELGAKPIAIYGRPYIKQNSVWCGGGHKLCAVIPRKEDEGPPDPQGLITVYGENGAVLEEHPYSCISIEEDGEGTTITWMP